MYQRRSPRLQGCDYTQEGAYFVTICTFQRVELFGEITDGAMKLNDLGEIAARRWSEITGHFPNVELDLSVVMPNHLHGILVLGEQPEKENRTRHASSLRKDAPNSKSVIGAKAGSLGAILGSYKSAVTREINALLSMHAPRVWQTRYHDHIIRSDADLRRLQEYVANNPARWEQDRFYVRHDTDAR